MSRIRLLPYLLLGLLVACGGRSRELIDGTAGTTVRQPPVVSVAAAGEGGATGSLAGGASDESGSAGQPTGGASGEAGASGQGGASEVGPECLVDADCAGTGECVIARCADGRCELRPAAFGLATSLQVAGDCSENVCDGDGASVTLTDPDDPPISASPCLIATCTHAGPLLRPKTPRTACASLAGPGWCDGAGSCVECLVSTDCAAGKVCGGHACVVAASCSDGQQDGQETSVDCGGPECDACDDSKTCRVDQDCESDLCDPLYLTCLPFSCRDGVKNGDESDVDCGGATCAGCYLAQQCNVAADCATHVCNGGSCAGSPCLDMRQDGSETDVDCGGLDCAPCLGGQKCRSNFDCADFRICARRDVNGPKVCQ